jgi:serine-type D-Ala-D-Ala carboxypeptidase (penicillin-binding protein 5/6)
MQTNMRCRVARNRALAGLAIVTSCAAAVIAIPTATLASSAGSAGTPSHPGSLDAAEIGGALLARHGVVVHYPRHGATPLPQVPASAYVIADARTGAVLAAKDAHGLFPPASTLKVLTAITMLPRLRPDATVLATKRAAYVEPNIVGLIPGHRYRVSDLFRALLLISANDAAVALVQASGSFAKGMTLVNAEAHHLQAYDVTAKQPNGLPAPGQVVSAYDLALIARKALSMPAFMRYDRTLTAGFPISRDTHVTLVNQNALLTQYPGGIGGKIGWTIKAEATYIGLARRHGVTLIVTILHATPLTEIASAERLLNWGFAADGRVTPVGLLVPPLSVAPLAATRKAAGTARPAGAASAVSGAQSRSASSSVIVGAGVAAGVCAVALAGLAWLRRRGIRGRHAAGG